MKRPPLFVAIVGGSGSGKTWLAEKLQVALREKATRLSLDDFYRDRSHLAPARRARLNFDNPASIDWLAFEQVLQSGCQWRETRLPSYNFKTHCRLRRSRTFQPKPIILVDGLWLLRRPAIRRFFGFRIFIECPIRTRLSRRLARDRLSRARTPASVKEQFWKTVQPMHKTFVLPQRRLADVVLREPWGHYQVKQLASVLRSMPGSEIIVELS